MLLTGYLNCAADRFHMFKDLDRIQTPEAKIILGAAVIDDVLGLIILAVVVSIVVIPIIGIHFIVNHCVSY